MKTRPVLSSEEPLPTYRWLPWSYLLLVGGVFLLCLWAEVNRRQQLNSAQTICSCVGANSLSTSVGEYALLRATAGNFINTRKNH